MRSEEIEVKCNYKKLCKFQDCPAKPSDTVMAMAGEVKPPDCFIRMEVKK